MQLGSGSNLSMRSPRSKSSREPSLEGYSPLQQVEGVERRDDDEVSEAEAIAGGVSRGGPVALAETPLNPGLGWVELGPFQSCVALVILLNMVVLAWETDAPDAAAFGVLNSLFLLLFAAEFLLRLLHKGPSLLLWHGKTRRWVTYDIVVLALGVVDIALVSMVCAGVAACGGQVFAGGALGESLGEQLASTLATSTAAPMAAPGLIFTEAEPQWWPNSPSRSVARRLLPAFPANNAYVRFFQLTRLLRIFRVLRMHKKLWDFIRLLGTMMNTFIWILGLMFFFGFVIAIILTRLIGQGIAVSSDDPEIEEQFELHFGSITTTLFTLFELTTTDDWARIAMPVIAVEPIWRLFFIAFIIFMSWTMLSLLTAVASDTMISSTTTKKHDQALFAEMQRQGFITFICAEFNRADKDGSGTLDKNEFMILMSEQSMKQQLKLHSIPLETRDLEKTWDTFDIDDSGELTIDELVIGFSILQEGLATKHVANIGYALKRFSTNVDREIEGLQEGLKGLGEQQDEVLKRILVQQRLDQKQWAEFVKRNEEREKAGSGSVAADDRMRAQSSIDGKPSAAWPDKSSLLRSQSDGGVGSQGLGEPPSSPGSRIGKLKLQRSSSFTWNPLKRR